MKPSDLLLLNNKSWAQERRQVDPAFFDRLAHQQTPQFLWIGCSDSRVPANSITGTDPGEIFVHRNIANVCVPNDVNMLSVVQYAVEVLEVKHVIVCGHYGCGGVNAALMDKEFTGPIGQWLKHIKAVGAKHSHELEGHTGTARSDRLVEWNAREHARTLAQLPVVQEAWRKRKAPWLHAWVYSLADGVLKELEAIAPGSAVGVAATARL
jgi:carbonic anhydrase